MKHEATALAWWNARVTFMWAAGIAAGVGGIGYIASDAFAIACGGIAAVSWLIARFCGNRFADAYQRAQTTAFVASRLGKPGGASATRSMARVVSRRQDS
jgi:hypothetical protein